MKTQSKTIKGLVAWILTFIVVVATAIPTFATTNIDSSTGNLVKLTNASTTTIYVGTTDNEANKNDILGLYQVIQTTFDEKNNTLTHQFTEEFNKFKQENQKYKDINEDTYMKYEEEQLKAVLGEFAAYVKAHRVEADKTANTGDTGIARFDTVGLGQYIVVGLGSSTGTKIYQTVSVEVQPSVENGEYKLYESYTVDMKTADVPIEKEVTVPSGDNSVSIGDKVTYTVTVGIPTYPAGATNKTFYMGDKMSNGLTFDDASLKVYTDEARKNLLDSEAYTVEKKEDTTNATFYVNFDYDKVVAAGATTLYVVYDAYINENAQVGTVGITNEAKLYYTSNPFDGNTWEPGHDGEEANGEASDTATVYTYGLVIKKYETANENKVLANATFEVYKASDIINEGADATVNSGAKPIATITTDVTGYIALNGLAKGTYYLKETKAPSGYNLLTELVQVELTNPTSKITTTNNYKYTSNIEEAMMDVQAQRIVDNTVEYGWLQKDSTKVTWAKNKPGDTYLPAYLLSTETSVSNSENGEAGYEIAKVENSTGAQLPSTGGAGRKVFYIAGPILMVGAGVILVTRKRMEGKDN